MAGNSKKKGKVRERKEKSLKPYYISLIVAAVVIVLGITALIFSDSISDEISKLRAGSKYVYTDYGEGKLPEDFIPILERAEEDEQANLEDYDVYLTVGDRQFAEPTVSMLYIDAFENHLNTAINDIYYYGYSTEGLSFDNDPADVEYSDNLTWAQYLYNEATEDFAEDLYLFDKGLSEGFIMDDSVVETLMNTFDTVSGYASPDTVVTNTYTEGVTVNIYEAHLIVSAFADAYEESKTEEIEDSVTADEISDLVSGNEEKFQTVKGRIYPISGGVDELEDVKTEEEFLAFAEKDNSLSDDAEEDYDAETETDISLTTYSYIANEYGDDVASYIFSPDREAGEISYINNGKYIFLVYIEEPAYYEATVSCVMYYELAYNSDDFEADNDEFTKLYNDWVDDGASRESLLKCCENTDYTGLTIPGGEMESKIADFSVEIDRWLRDPARKKGDHEVFLLDSIRAIVYFDKVNAEGSDKDLRAREAIARTRFADDYSSENDENYAVVPADEDMMDAFFDNSSAALSNMISDLFS